MPHETLRERIARHEGFRSLAYKDSLGVLTIGIGRNIAKKGISVAEAYYLLDNDIAECKQQIDKYLPWAKSSLNDTRYGVVVEACFQLGIQGLLAFKNTLKALQAGDYNKTVEGMLASKWAKQTPARVKELAQIMLRG